LLSTAAIGALSATVTQYQSCARDLEADSLEFKRLSDDIPGRNKLLYRKLSDTENEDEYDKKIELFTSGESFFVYSEFKGKSINELSLTRTMLAKKINPSWIAKNLMVC